MPPASPRALARARPALAPLRPRAPHPPPSSSSSSSSSSARRARPPARGASSSSSSSPPPAPSASTSEGGDTAAPTLVLYTKPGCCLCEGLAEKLEEVMSTRAGGAMGDVLRAMRLETRDVSARADWAEAHATEVPVVTLLVAAAAGKEDDGGKDREGAPPREVPLPRPAPRLSAARLAVRLGQDVQSALSPGDGDGARARTGWAAPRRKKAAGGSNEANGGWTVVSERPF